MKKALWALIVASTIVLCAIIVLLYSFWGYLQTSITPIALARTKTISPTIQAQPSPAPSPQPVGTPSGTYLGYTAHTFSAQGNTLTYYLFIPVNYNPAQKYPLVLLLQGGGERSKPGNTAAQNEKLLLGDPYAAVWSSDYNAPGNPQIQQHWPCFVVVPQIELSQQWVNVNVNAGSYIQPAQPSIPLGLTKDLLDMLQKEYTGIDSTRLYITGLSNGGYGTWDAIERWPDYFAAAAPIAGAGDPSKAAVLRDLPIWAFHGSADTTVPVSGSRDMIAAIQSAGGFPRYTEFAGQGHGVWPYVYGLNTNPLRVTDFFPWFFAQHR